MLPSLIGTTKREYKHFIVLRISKPVDESSSRPLNSVGLPFYRETLASAWPDQISDVGAPPVKFDAQFLASLKPTDFGLYGRNTRGLRRNQVEDMRHSHKSASSGLKAPKFLSEKARESATSDFVGVGLKNEELTSPVAEHENGSKKSDVPVMYRTVEIKYSKFGVDDFDFGYASLAHRPMDLISFAHTKLQILQQNTVLWLGNPYY